MPFQKNKWQTSSPSDSHPSGLKAVVPGGHEEHQCTIAFNFDQTMWLSRSRRGRRDESKSRPPGRGSDGNKARSRARYCNEIKAQPRGRDEFLRDRLPRRGSVQDGHLRRFHDVTRVPQSLRRKRDGDRASSHQHVLKDATACPRGGNYPRENTYDQNIECNRNRDLDKKSQLRS